MSAPAQGEPSVPKEEKGRRTLTRVLTRMRTVLKRGESSKKRQSTLLTPGDSFTAPAATTTDAAASTSAAPAPAETDKGKAAEKPVVEATLVPRSQLFEERAKKLGERFGLEIKPTEWYTTEGNALRVEKPIRMRVHRKCHNCDAFFGLARECPNCEHVRCKKCPRAPPKRSEAEKEESRKRRAALLKERAENPPIVADWDTTEKNIELKKPSKTGGQDLVYKKARQRIRRSCCQCQTQYSTIQSTECASCHHVRCTDCPRDPAKKDKYPYGYPGDAFGANSIPYYACHNCQTKFPPNPTEETECPGCQHKKCESCERLRPKKVAPEPDPEVWQSVQAKLAELDLK